MMLDSTDYRGVPKSDAVLLVEKEAEIARLRAELSEWEEHGRTCKAEAVVRAAERVVKESSGGTKVPSVKSIRLLCDALAAYRGRA